MSDSQTISLKNHSDSHLARKIFHTTGVLMMFLSLQFFSEKVCWYLLLSSGLFLVSFDLIRQRFEKANSFALTYFKGIMRESERHSLSGVTFLFLGTIVCFYLFDSTIVGLSLLFLAIADPLASWVGINYGSDKIFGKKSLQGTLAAFVVSTIIAAIYFNAKNLLIDHIYLASFIAGIIGALSEVVPIFKLDDNFTQPVISGLLLTGLFLVFGGM